MDSATRPPLCRLWTKVHSAGLTPAWTTQEEIKTVYGFDEFVGKSDVLKFILEKIEQVAKADATVLILGETGTGKELVARAIHEHSGRKDHPLVKVVGAK